MVNCSYRASRASHRTKGFALGGFTLAELLIVIAIIAVLIGILLPALSAARRSSASVKCLASLKQIGQAFQMYAQDNKRYFPVMRWNPVGSGLPAAYGGGGINPAEDTNDKERIWIDFIARYLIKKETYSNPTLYLQYQQNSVLWGCPSFDTALFDANGNYPSLIHGSKRYSMSYGMSYASLGPYQTGPMATDKMATPITGPPIPGTSLNFFNIADIGPTPRLGMFYKMEQWGRKGQSKGLIADSNGFSLTMSQQWSRATEIAGSATPTKTEPKFMGIDYPVTATPTGTWIMIDATRHIAATANVSKVLKERGTNMLFVDGHAQPVTPREAWIATWGGGFDMTQP